MGHEPQRQPDMEPEEHPDLFDEQELDAAGERSAPQKPPAPGSAPSHLLGQTIGGRYRFDDLLGEGTFARVYKVYDLHRRAYLAAKVLRSDIAQEPMFLERFQREAVVLSRLQHPHIVRYYDIVEMDGYMFILTDYIEGQTLQSVLHSRGEPITPLDSLTYLTPLAAALHFAHREGIVHRDLKPANILIDANDTLYVTDFGIARILSDSSTLTMDMSVGTPHYMSPEQILAGEITPAADIYALGVILYQMYTGRLPFTGESQGARGATTAVRIAYEHLHVPPEPPRNLNPRISEAVQAVILHCLEKDPAQRYGSVSEAYDALTDAIGTPSVSLDSQELAGDAAPSAPPAAPGPAVSDAQAAEAASAGYDAWDEEEVPGAEPIASWADKPKRKAKRRPQSEPYYAPRQGEKQREKDRESQEKQDEKDRDNQEKRNEKGDEKTNEKGEFWGDLAPSDRLSQVTWGGIALWAGIVFLLNNAGTGGNLFANPLAWIMSGAGALLLGEVATRIAIPEYRSKPGARMVLGLVLLMVGVGIGFNLGSLWPLLLIALGIGFLFNQFFE